MRKLSRDMLKLADQHLVGEEVTKFDPPVTADDDPRIAGALNYYNYYFTSGEMRDAIETYILNHPLIFTPGALNLFENVPDKWVSLTDCAICEIINNGNPLPKSYIDRLAARVNQSLKYATIREQDGDETTVSIVERTRQAAMRQIGDIEMMVDMCDYGDKIDMYQFLTDRQIAGKVAQHIRAYYADVAIEVIAAFNEEDDDLVHAFRHIAPEHLEQRAELFNGIVDDIDRFVGNKQVSRMPRKKKTKSASAQVSKVQYQKADSDLKLTSIDPTAILGASQLWMYNTQKRVLTVLHGLEGGLSLKGTTVQNFNEETSKGKKLRKPAEILDKVRSEGKVPLRSLLNNIRAGEKSASGRLNEYTILVRAIK